MEELTSILFLRLLYWRITQGCTWQSKKHKYMAQTSPKEYWGNKLGTENSQLQNAFSPMTSEDCSGLHKERHIFIRTGHLDGIRICNLLRQMNTEYENITLCSGKRTDNSNLLTTVTMCFLSCPWLHSMNSFNK